MIECDVLIPFYGEKKYLYSCINSINEQVLSDISIKVTVINDNPDEQLNLSQPKNPNVTLNIINNKQNLGLAKNWNKCLSLNESKYFHMLHYDDLLEKDFYQVMINELAEKTGAGILICKAKNLFINKLSSRYWSSLLRSEKKLSSYNVTPKGDQAIKEIMREKFVCSAVLLTQKAISNSGFFLEELKFSPDEEYWARVAKNNDLVITQKELVGYRHHDKNYALKTWSDPDFFKLYLKTRMERLNLLEDITQEDKETELEKISHTLLGIGYKLFLKDYRELSKFYIDKAIEVYPDVVYSVRYIRIAKVLNSHPIRSILEKFRSAH